MKKNFLLLFVSVLLMLVVSEAVLTVFFRDNIRPYRIRAAFDDNAWLNNEPYLLPGEDNTWEVAKNFSGKFNTGGTITTNRYGFRTTPEMKEESYDKIDILCMGDSMTFGFPLDDKQTFPYYLQKIFKEQNEDIVVANAGYSGGFTLDTAYLEFKDRLYRFKPKIVLYGLYPGNDYVEFGIWREKDQAGLPKRIEDFMRLTCGFYRVPVLRESCLFIALGRVFYRCRYCREKAESFTEEVWWDKIPRVVEGFKKITDREGTELIFVFLRAPYRERLGRFKQSSDLRQLEVLKEYNLRLKDILKKNKNIYWDDYDLIESLKEALTQGKLPPVPRSLMDDLKKALSSSNSATPDRVLASPDGEHNSALTNLYIANWLYSKLKTII